MLAPHFANAFPFGGRITLYHVCYNETLFARLSPPVPGDYVWTTATRTYQFGPPRAAGQWLLGLTGIPFDCLWSVSPIFPVPAIAIMMMGSSQATFSGISSGGYTSDPTLSPKMPSLSGSGTGTGSTGSGSASGKLVISEIYYDVASGRGTDPTHEWIELYNGTQASVDISGWKIQTAHSSSTIPAGTSIPQRSFAVISPATNLKSYWTIPSDVRIVTLNGPIGNGLARGGDAVILKNTSGTAIDGVSWGTSTAAFSPAVPTVPSGRSLYRKSIFSDTDTAQDWGDAQPSPGN